MSGTELEEAEHKNQPDVVARLIRSIGFMEARCIIECRSLVHKAAMLGFVDCVRLLVEEGGGDVEGLLNGCPEAWDACRRAGGHICRTPLCAAASEELYPLDGRARVAEYLLKLGADPVAESDEFLRTPFVEACATNSFPILKLILDGGFSESPSGIAYCKGTLMEMRRLLNTRGRSELRPLVELLSRAVETAGGAMDEKNERLKMLTKSNREGNARFWSGDFAGAARRFKSSVEHCESALAMCDDAETTAAWEARMVAVCCNAASACLRLGAFKDSSGLLLPQGAQTSTGARQGDSETC